MRSRFQPDAVLLAELRRRCVDSLGEPWSDVRWDEGYECLCVYRRNREGLWRIDRPLVTDYWTPRNMRRKDIDDEVQAKSAALMAQVAIIGHDGQLKRVPKFYADLVAARKAREAEHQAKMEDEYQRIATKMDDAIRGDGTFSGTAYRKTGARDWSQWQGVMCRHEKQILSCNECKPDRPVKFFRSGTGRGRDGVKGRVSA